MSLQPGLPLITGNIGSQSQPNQFVRYVDPDVYLVQPYATPVYQLSRQGARQESTTNYKFEWQHDTLRTQTLVLQAGITGGAPTATYTDTANVSFFAAGDKVWNDTTQQMLSVTSVNTGTGVVTLATYDGSNVTSSSSGDKMLYVSTPISQGGLIQTAKNTVIDQPFNYTETFTTPFEVDSTTLRSKLYQGNQWTYLHSKKIEEHKWQQEYSDIWGVKFAGTLPDGNFGTLTDGLFSLISDHVSYTHAGFSITLFDAWLRDHVFKFGRRDKVILMNNKAASDLNGVFVNSLRVNFPEMKDNMTFALSVARWVSGYGVVKFILMPQAFVGNDANQRGMFIALQGEYLKARFLEPTGLKDNIQNPRALKREAGLVSQVGLQYAPAETGSVFLEAAS